MVIATTNIGYLDYVEVAFGQWQWTLQKCGELQMMQGTVHY